MQEFKKSAYEYIDNNSAIFTGVSDAIWGYAEMPMCEHRSAELYCKLLREHGFTVTEGLGGMPTAFSGAWGHGRPVIGILAEYDALSGLSQKAASAERCELVPGGPGHGCGHNMLGAGSLAAAFAVKDYLEKSGREGTVIFYGCPGEESGAGKTFMARDNAWAELDAALTWHPADTNHAVTGSCLSCIQYEYTFRGISAHAAGNPEAGRSALDAVQLMNLGAEFLREHMPSSARIHYAITDGGGISPNVVPSCARVVYMVRDHKVHDALKLQARVDDLAKGAALMTGTTVTQRFIDGCANTITNEPLEKLLYKNLCEAPAPEYTEEELAYAAALVASIETEVKTPEQVYEDMLDSADLAFVREASDNGRKPINDFVVPYKYSKKVSMGSTDVGDVSWQTPTAQIETVCFVSGSPGHSWQNVSSGCSSIGHKGLLYAARALAGAAIELYEDSSLLEAAKADLAVKAAAGYSCPIPADASPVPAE